MQVFAVAVSLAALALSAAFIVKVAIDWVGWWKRWGKKKK